MTERPKKWVAMLGNRLRDPLSGAASSQVGQGPSPALAIYVNKVKNRSPNTFTREDIVTLYELVVSDLLQRNESLDSLQRDTARRLAAAKEEAARARRESLGTRELRESHRHLEETRDKLRDLFVSLVDGVIAREEQPDENDDEMRGWHGR